MPRPLFDRVVSVTINLNTAGSVYIASPYKGKVIKVQSVIHGAPNANAVMTTGIAAPGSTTFTAITGGGFTIATASAAAGDYDEANPTAANIVEQNGILRVTSDGGPSADVNATINFVIRER